MKTKFHIPEILIFIIAVLPFAYLGHIYSSLPAIVPTHFGIDGKPDGFNKKSFLWLIVSITGTMSILLYLLMRFLPSIDPKKTAKYSAATFNKIGVALVLFLCLMNCLIINATQKSSFTIGNTIPAVVGVFFAFMGNIMPTLKPNYFAGIRTPWTLENEEVWKKTHRLAGKLWFAGGILIVALSLSLPVAVLTYALIIITIILALIPVIYSYKCFKSIQKNH